MIFLKFFSLPGVFRVLKTMEMSKWTTRWKTKRWLRDSTLAVALILIAQAASVTAGKEQHLGHRASSEHPEALRGVRDGIRKAELSVQFSTVLESDC